MKEQELPKELLDYAELIHGQPYNIFTDNCIHKNLKVARMAQRLGLTSKLIFCLAQTPLLLGLFRLYNLHTYLEVEGIKVDVFYADIWGSTRITKGRIELCAFRPNEGETNKAEV